MQQLPAPLSSDTDPLYAAKRAYCRLVLGQPSSPQRDELLKTIVGYRDETLAYWVLQDVSDLGEHSEGLIEIIANSGNARIARKAVQLLKLGRQ